MNADWAIKRYGLGMVGVKKSTKVKKMTISSKKSPENVGDGEFPEIIVKNFLSIIFL